ncbi:MAG: hypothetical protein RR309_07205 [Cellulosilyticaceae bacterium]
MRRVKGYLLKIVMVMSVMLCGFTVYGSDTRFTQPSKTESAVTKDGIVNKLAKTTDTTTSQSITFEKDEYVRITQPIKKDGVTCTFDSQINVMGEAREGTNVVITVSLSTEENMEEKKLPVKYELPVVGATQTFNQLIELNEGTNIIVISYTNLNTKNVYGEMTFTLKREKEDTKKAIKGYIVDQKVILDKVGK